MHDFIVTSHIKLRFHIFFPNQSVQKQNPSKFRNTGIFILNLILQNVSTFNFLLHFCVSTIYIFFFLLETQFIGQCSINTRLKQLNWETVLQEMLPPYRQKSYLTPKFSLLFLNLAKKLFPCACCFFM